MKPGMKILIGLGLLYAVSRANANTQTAPQNVTTVTASNVSPNGIASIKKRYPARLLAIKSGSDYLIGHAHRVTSADPAAWKNTTGANSITPGQATEILGKDLYAITTQIAKTIKVPLTQNQFDALASLALSIGPTWTAQPFVAKINAGDYYGAATLIRNVGTSWKKPDGTIFTDPGMVALRASEADQFLG